MASEPRSIAIAFGTRPEAVKMAPIVKALEASDAYRPLVAVTGQHREMLDQVLDLFAIRPDHDLNLMRPGQGLESLTARAVTGITEYLRLREPDALVVQGDTTSTFAAALAAFYAGVPVVHVEAGLRTGNKLSPFPEEMNRMLTSRLTDLHLAPTPGAAANLRAEGIEPSSIAVTGNTVIDALMATVENVRDWSDPGYDGLFTSGHRTVLVTAHRRESWGDKMRASSEGLRQLLDTFADIQIVFPVHRNPIVRNVVTDVLGGDGRVKIIEPASYPDFCRMMSLSHLIITDSGGVQEEAPSLGKPVLVLRDTTERPEAIDAGTAKLVGTEAESVFSEAAKLLSNQQAFDQMANAVNPYGDGKAAARSVAALDHFFGYGPRMPDFVWDQVDQAQDQQLTGDNAR